MIRARLVLLVGILALVLSGCGLGTAGGFSPTGRLAGPLADVPSLKGASIAVGSKNFSEQLLVGKMAVILLKSDGADVSDYTNIPGSSSTRQAQLGNQLQMTWDYTGTAWISYLGHADPIPDATQQYEAVRDEDAQRGLVWLPPAPMNNTYGFASKKAVAEKLGVKKLSDLKNIPVEQRTLCVDSEFANRNDGLQPMLQRYGVPLGSGIPNGNVHSMDTGAIYAAIDRGVCNFGEIFTTDGRIKSLNLSVLDDDLAFFPKYNLCPVINRAVYDRYPQLKDLFGPVAAKLTNETLIDLNAQIDVDGREPAGVAYAWLLKEGFIRE